MSIRRACHLALLATCAAFSTPAQAQTLKPELAGIAFLVGDWTSGQGRVGDTGGTATGSSRIEPQVGGAVLLRRDHTELAGPHGQKMGSFDQIMMIYQESGGLHADYADGTHVIHYVSAVVVAGKSVIFASAPASNAPTFKLAYLLASPNTLDIAFSAAPPGSTVFHPIATGSLTRGRTP